MATTDTATAARIARVSVDQIRWCRWNRVVVQAEDAQHVGSRHDVLSPAGAQHSERHVAGPQEPVRHIAADTEDDLAGGYAVEAHALVADLLLGPDLAGRGHHDSSKPHSARNCRVRTRTARPVRMTGHSPR